MGEKIVFSKSDFGKTDIHMQKNEVDPYLTSYTELTWIKDLSVRAKTTKLLKWGKAL